MEGKIETPNPLLSVVLWQAVQLVQQLSKNYYFFLAGPTTISSNEGKELEEGRRYEGAIGTEESEHPQKLFCHSASHLCEITCVKLNESSCVWSLERCRG